MAKTTIIFGILLIALGVVGYMGGGSAPASDAPEPAAEASDDSKTDSEAGENKKSVTALIPAFVGAILLLCGVVALKESARKHAMHLASVVGLLGLLAGAGRGSMGIGKFLSGDASLNQRSFLFVWIMAILCGIFLVLCIRSFIEAKKRRLAAEAAN